MRFALPDDRVVTGRSYDDIVKAMSDEKLTAVTDLAKYRKATARRAKVMYGEHVPYETSKDFVHGLLHVGLLRRAK